MIAPSIAPLPISPDEVLRGLDRLYGQERSQDLEGLTEVKSRDLERYDVPGIDRVAAIMAWGRSGSLLLASYFDSHDDVILLPEVCGKALYDFFEQYQSLSLRDKLLGYPAFRPEDTRFFEGQFAISPTHYYAAVQAIVAASRRWPMEFVVSRRAFFVAIHVAYSLALGRRTATSRPLIIYAQHEWGDVAAGKLVDDFPGAKFIHTVRDPISSLDASFNLLVPQLAEKNIFLPYSVLYYFTSRQDEPHTGMKDRTRTVRFEDMHADPEGTMRWLAEWLDLPFRTNLVTSSFNGIPWVVSRDGKSWSGRSADQVGRRSRHLSRRGRTMLFALLSENFFQWEYACPKIFRHRLVRCLVTLILLPVPLRIELVGARAVLEQRILPSLRRRNVLRAVKSLAGIARVRVRIMGLLVQVVSRRCFRPPVLVQVEHHEL